jgi:uncharacterized protein (DUF1330 family)
MTPADGEGENMPAYIVFTRKRITDQAEMDIYAPLAGASMKGHAVTPLAAYGALQMLEGDPVEGAVIVEFPTVEEARAWYDSPAYQAALVHRQAGSDYSAFIVDGVG